MILRRRDVLWICRRFCSSLSADRALQSLKERGLLHRSTSTGSPNYFDPNDIIATLRFDPPPPSPFIMGVGPLKRPPGSAVYVGFDPTADSLHVGNLLAILALLHFRHAGYQPIAVLQVCSFDQGVDPRTISSLFLWVGGATGAIGDPSGRLTEREKLESEGLEKNIAGITETLTRIFQNDEGQQKSATSEEPRLKILNNADWWNGVSAMEFVSDIARSFRLTTMLGKESVKQRLQSEEGMSCTEFLYPVFQAYDFLHLHKHHLCWMQIGGGDQWGNITAGCEYVRKMTGKIVHGLTLPLLTSISGEKIGKSVGNAVWLSAEKTSCYELYQYLVRTTDQDVRRFLEFFTFLSREEVQSIMTEHESSPEKFTAQKCLAEHVTKLVHGESGLQQALNATAILFGDVDTLRKISGNELEQLFKDAPSVELPCELLACGDLTVLELALKTDTVPSRYYGQNLIKSGGLYINFVRVSSTEELFHRDKHLLTGNMTILRTGKKNYRLIKWK